jgi:hypothetical protein
VNMRFFLFVAIAIIMALMPFGETPHLWQKLQLLKSGYLHKPVDWFDLSIHGVPLLLVLINLVQKLVSRVKSGSQSP